MPHYYRITQETIYEVLDTEVVAINFLTGDYYTFPGIAKQVWQMLENGNTIAAIAEILAAHYQVDPTQVMQDIEPFIQRLYSESLLEEGDSVTPNNGLDILNADKRHQWNYQVPQIHKHSDLNDLLLLDPIHDVDSAGWPNQPADSTALHVETENAK